MFTFFYRYLKYRLAIIAFLASLVSIFDGLGLAMFVPLLQLVAGNQDIKSAEMSLVLKSLHEFLDRANLDLTLTTVFLSMFLLFTLKGVASFFQTYYNVIIHALFMRKIRFKMIDGLSRMKYESFSQMNAGKIQNTLTGETLRAGYGLLQYFGMIKLSLMLFVYMSLALLNNFEFALMVIMGAGVSNFVYKKVFSRTKSLSSTFVEQAHVFTGRILQSIDFYKYLKATDSIQAYYKRVKWSIKELEITQKRMGFYNAVLSSTREILVLGIIILTIVFYVNFMHGEITSIVLSLLFYYRGMNSFMNLQKAWNSCLNNLGSLQNIQDLQKEIDEKREQIEFQQLPVSFQKNIHLQDISFSYTKDGKAVLRKINLEIKKNQTIALIGESGSGKTTLANIIAGLILPTEGRIVVDNTPLGQNNYRSFRSKIGYITQEAVVFNDTLFNNISFWEDFNDQNQQKLGKAIQKSHLQKTVDKLPDQEHTPLGDKGVSLSGGQKQRVSIAREMYRGCEILIMDEATSALDTETEKIIQENIDELKGQFTILLIAHRLSTIKNADCICLMSDGKISAIGTFDELFSSNPQFKKMVNLQDI